MRKTLKSIKNVDTGGEETVSEVNNVNSCMENAWLVDMDYNADFGPTVSFLIKMSSRADFKNIVRTMHVLLLIF